MTVLVTGGTGFIGSAIIRELLLGDEPVRAITRRSVPQNADSLLLPVQWVGADVMDPTSLRFALRDCDTLYHVAGAIATHPSEAQLAFDVNVTGTRNLLDAALVAGVRRVVYTASIFALGVGDAAIPPVNENIDYNLEQLRSPYMRAKREAEAVIQEYRERGLDIVAVYPGFCAGPGDVYLTSSRFIVSFLKGILPGFPPSGLCQVDVRDAAHAHILAMYISKPNEKFLVTGHNITYKQMLEQLSSIIQRHLPLIPLPRASLTLAGTIAERLSHRPLIDSGMTEILQYRWWYDDSKARVDLGIEYRPLEDTFRDAITWFAQKGIISQRFANL